MRSIALTMALAAGLLAARAPAQDAHWPSFRGPNGAGVADAHPTAAKWNVGKNENVRWKTRIPGLAHSSPVIWGDRVFVTTAVRVGANDAELKVGLYGSVESVPAEGEHLFQVLCLDRESGAVLWVRTAWQGVPHFKRHPKGSFAASTPTTDGERVVAFFGTEGLYCYDVTGQLQWKVDLGRLEASWYVAPDKAQWGYAASPILDDGRVYVQCDVQGDSFLAALDAATGKELWRTPREEVPTWSTPTLHDVGGRQQIICNGFKHIGAYDASNGKAIWWLKGGGDIPVPRPVVGHDHVYITNAHGRMAPVIAIALSATGELQLDADRCEHVTWSTRNGGNYMQTPIVYGDHLYLCKDMGILTCVDARTGERVYRERLDTGLGFTASGVAADGKLYFTSEQGDVYVVKAGEAFEILAINELGETCMASPAIAEGMLFFRTRHHLVAIAAAAK